MTFFSNWTVLDLVRSVVDRTAKGGVVGLGGEADHARVFLPPEGPEQRNTLARLGDSIAEYGATVHDLRDEPRKGRGAAHGTRLISNVTALWWHQSAAVLGRPHRYLGVPCHAAVMQNGDIALLHPIVAYVYHGHSANKFSIGIEVDCRAAGVEGDGRTFWRSRAEKAAGKRYEELVREPTARQLQSCFALGVYFTEEVDRLGGEIKAQGFHRNSHSSRTSDPGSRIALNVAHPLSVRYGQEYGGPVVGSGHPTRAEWYPKETTT